MIFRTMPRLHLACFVAFVASGFAALLYQSVWARYLGLILGHAAYAQTVVLCLFMGGMALGAWLAASLSKRTRAPLIHAYVVAELLIGGAALVFHPLFLVTTAFATDHVAPEMGGPAASTLLKIALSILLIGGQCVLLGMTFPLLSCALIRTATQRAGALLATLYFTNSIGAAFGALVATFLIVPTYGLPGAMWVGGIVNVVVAIIVWIAYTTARVIDVAEPETERSPAGAVENTDCKRLTNIVLFLTLGSSAASFIYEVSWVRMLSLVLGSTIHAFELMLSAFILGLALGSLWVRNRIDACADPMKLVGAAQILMGLSALLTVFVYVHSFEGTADLMRSVARTDGGYNIFVGFSAMVAILIMAPTAFFAGMTLPLFTATLLRRGAADTAIGRVYAANTVGAIFGALLGVHVLIPALGLKLSVIVGAAVDLAIGIYILRALVLRFVMSHYAVGALVSVIAVAATLQFPKFEVATLTSGVYRTSSSQLPDNEVVTFYRDGKTATIAVRENLVSKSVRISTNGKIDASLAPIDLPPTGDESTMVLAAIIGAHYRGAVRTAAVVGFGSGLTTHTLLGFPAIESVETIEIEPMIYEGAKLFGQRVELAYTDPRSVLAIEDAKSYLSGNGKKYDLIVSEPSNPWVSGVASLFTDEFYGFTKRHLNDDGILIQWIQLYEINTELVGSILLALDKNYPDYHLYISNSTDMLVVASPKEKLPVIGNTMARSARLEDELQRLGIGTLEEVKLRAVADRDLVKDFLAQNNFSINSDYYPIVAFNAPKARFRNQSSIEFSQLPSARAPYHEMLLGLSPPATEASITPRFENDRVGETILARQIDVGLSTRNASKVELDETLRFSTALLVSAGPNCLAGLPTSTALEAVYQLSSHVNRYGSVSARNNQWIRRDWLACSSVSDPGVQAFLELAKATAERDPTQMLATATTLLTNHIAALSPDMQEYALNIALIAAIVGKEKSRAEDLANKYSAIPQGSLSGESALRAFLVARARATPAPTSSTDNAGL